MIHKKELREIFWNLIWQVALAVGFMTLVLLVLGYFAQSPIIWAVGAGALAASSFLVFAAPKSPVSRPSHIVCGYAIGMFTGLLLHYVLTQLYGILLHHETMFVHDKNIFWIAASLALGLSIILMVIFDKTHPPAVGMSIVLVLDIRHYFIILVLFGCAVILALLRYGLRHHLKNLVT